MKEKNLFPKIVFQLEESVLER